MARFLEGRREVLGVLPVDIAAEALAFVGADHSRLVHGFAHRLTRPAERHAEWVGLTDERAVGVDRTCARFLDS